MNVYAYYLLLITLNGVTTDWRVEGTNALCAGRGQAMTNLA